MRSSLAKFVLTLSVAIAACAFITPDASAQQQRTAKPPQPSRELSGNPFLNTAAAVLLTAGVVGAAGFRSKRGHQD